MRARSSVAALLLLLLAMTGRVARAEDADAMARARARFEAGRALYVLGDYDSALREFMSGYQLVQKPRFLINLGQCYVKLHQPAKAREMYERFLATAPNDDPERATVEQLVAELSQAQSAPEPAPAPPPSPRAPETAAPAPQTAAPPSSALVPSGAAAAAATPAPPRKHFDRRHLAWIVPLGAVVVGGVAVGIYFALQPKDGCASGLGCIDATHPR